MSISISPLFFNNFQSISTPPHAQFSPTRETLSSAATILQAIADSRAETSPSLQEEPDFLSFFEEISNQIPDLNEALCAESESWDRSDFIAYIQKWLRENPESISSISHLSLSEAVLDIPEEIALFRALEPWDLADFFWRACERNNIQTIKALQKKPILFDSFSILSVAVEKAEHNSCEEILNLLLEEASQSVLDRLVKTFGNHLVFSHVLWNSPRLDDIGIDVLRTLLHSASSMGNDRILRLIFSSNAVSRFSEKDFETAFKALGRRTPHANLFLKSLCRVLPQDSLCQTSMQKVMSAYISSGVAKFQRR